VLELLIIGRFRRVQSGEAPEHDAPRWTQLRRSAHFVLTGPSGGVDARWQEKTDAALRTTPFPQRLHPGTPEKNQELALVKRTMGMFACGVRTYDTRSLSAGVTVQPRAIAVTWRS
jgi:hypothetical protein